MSSNVSKWRLLQACQKRLGDVTTNLRKKSVWGPMLKNVLSTTITIIIGVHPAVVKVYGKSTHLAAIVSVFGQPGQRFGKMAETLCLIPLGTLFGLGWGNLGLCLSSLLDSRHIRASWAIRAIFIIIAVIFHGVLRSSTPRLFRLVLFFMIVHLSVLAGSEITVTLSAFQEVVYPIFTGIVVVVLVNVTVFPQFSSGFLGTSTIETLSQTIEAYLSAGDWFMSDTDAEGNRDEEKVSPIAMRTRLVSLTEMKPKLRARLGSCKATQAECNFELVFAVLPPRSLKPISVTMMTRLVQVTISLINACESKFALAAYNENRSTSENSKFDKADSKDIEFNMSCDQRVPKSQRRIDLIQPTREIKSGDADVLEHIMTQIRHPARIMQDRIRNVVLLIASALAYCYDVSKLPSGYPKSDGIILEELDIRIEIFTEALTQFEIDSAAALKSAAATVYDRCGTMDSIAPCMETHLASSFLININQAAAQVLEMLNHARTLIEKRQNRTGRRKLYWPRPSWKKWLTSGGEEDRNVLPENARKEAQTGYGPMEDIRSRVDESASTSRDATLQKKTDEETGLPGSAADVVPERRKGLGHDCPPKSLPFCGNILWLRGLAADTVEFIRNSGDLAYALKMALAVSLVTWPAFVPSLHSWYALERGTWATQMLIILFDVSIGTTFRGFFLRALGTVFGCGVAILAWEVGQGNRIALVIVLAIGLLPGCYIQWNTPYAKAGVVFMVTMSLVGIETVVRVNSDSPGQICAKRLVSMLIGGAVALGVEMTVFPVRARDRLVESLASAVTQISLMESSVAAGVDSASTVDIKSHALNAHFKSAKKKAEKALDAAQTFLPFSLTEPRIESGYTEQALVYGEMINVLFQIIERMENMLHIWKRYGNSALEELHAEMLPHRRNVAGCVTLTLFAVQEALTSRLPLPQFLPSGRVAQLRYIAHVRELLYARGQGAVAENTTDTGVPRKGSSTVTVTGTKDIKSTALEDLVWKASSAGMIEVIEYLEELVDLAKLLVGVNVFRSVQRPRLRDYLASKGRKSKGTSARTETPENKKTTKCHQGGGGRKGSGHPLPSFGERSSAIRPAVLSDDACRRRQWAVPSVADTGDSTLDYDEALEVHESDVSWALQRIMMKRREESEKLARSRMKDSENPKGKYPCLPRC